MLGPQPTRGYFTPLRQLQPEDLPEGWRHQETVDVISDVAQRVVKVYIRRMSRQRPANIYSQRTDYGGTGFAYHVSRNVVKIRTSMHVLYNVEEAREATVEFSLRVPGARHPTVLRLQGTDHEFNSCSTEDYTIITCYPTSQFCERLHLFTDVPVLWNERFLTESYDDYENNAKLPTVCGSFNTIVRDQGLEASRMSCRNACHVHANMAAIRHPPSDTLTADVKPTDLVDEAYVNPLVHAATGTIYGSGVCTHRGVNSVLNPKEGRQTSGEYVLGEKLQACSALMSGERTVRDLGALEPGDYVAIIAHPNGGEKAFSVGLAVAQRRDSHAEAVPGLRGNKEKDEITGPELVSGTIHDLRDTEEGRDCSSIEKISAADRSDDGGDEIRNDTEGNDCTCTDERCPVDRRVDVGDARRRKCCLKTTLSSASIAHSNTGTSSPPDFMARLAHCNTDTKSPRDFKSRRDRIYHTHTTHGCSGAPVLLLKRSLRVPIVDNCQHSGTCYFRDGTSLGFATCFAPEPESIAQSVCISQPISASLVGFSRRVEQQCEECYRTPSRGASTCFAPVELGNVTRRMCSSQSISAKVSGLCRGGKQTCAERVGTSGKRASAHTPRASEDTFTKVVRLRTEKCRNAECMQVGGVDPHKWPPRSRAGTICEVTRLTTREHQCIASMQHQLSRHPQTHERNDVSSIGRTPQSTPPIVLERMNKTRADETAPSFYSQDQGSLVPALSTTSEYFLTCAARFIEMSVHDLSSQNVLYKPDVNPAPIPIGYYLLEGGAGHTRGQGQGRASQMTRTQRSAQTPNIPSRPRFVNINRALSFADFVPNFTSLNANGNSSNRTSPAEDTRRGDGEGQETESRTYSQVIASRSSSAEKDDCVRVRHTWTSVRKRRENRKPSQGLTEPRVGRQHKETSDQIGLTSLHAACLPSARRSLFERATLDISKTSQKDGIRSDYSRSQSNNGSENLSVSSRSPSPDHLGNNPKPTTSATHQLRNCHRLPDIRPAFSTSKSTSISPAGFRDEAMSSADSASQRSDCTDYFLRHTDYLLRSATRSRPKEVTSVGSDLNMDSSTDWPVLSQPESTNSSLKRTCLSRTASPRTSISSSSDFSVMSQSDSTISSRERTSSCLTTSSRASSCVDDADIESLESSTDDDYISTTTAPKVLQSGNASVESADETVTKMKTLFRAASLWRVARESLDTTSSQTCAHEPSQSPQQRHRSPQQGPSQNSQAKAPLCVREQGLQPTISSSSTCPQPHMEKVVSAQPPRRSKRQRPASLPKLADIHWPLTDVSAKESRKRLTRQDESDTLQTSVPAERPTIVGWTADTDVFSELTRLGSFGDASTPSTAKPSPVITPYSALKTVCHLDGTSNFFVFPSIHDPEHDETLALKPPRETTAPLNTSDLVHENSLLLKTSDSEQRWVFTTKTSDSENEQTVTLKMADFTHEKNLTQETPDPKYEKMLTLETSDLETSNTFEQRTCDIDCSEERQDTVCGASLEHEQTFWWKSTNATSNNEDEVSEEVANMFRLGDKPNTGTKMSPMTEASDRHTDAYTKLPLNDYLEQSDSPYTPLATMSPSSAASNAVQTLCPDTLTFLKRYSTSENTLPLDPIDTDSGLNTPEDIVDSEYITATATASEIDSCCDLASFFSDTSLCDTSLYEHDFDEELEAPTDKVSVDRRISKEYTCSEHAHQFRHEQSASLAKLTDRVETDMRVLRLESPTSKGTATEVLTTAACDWSSSSRSIAESHDSKKRYFGSATLKRAPLRALVKVHRELDLPEDKTKATSPLIFTADGSDLWDWSTLVPERLDSGSGHLSLELPRNVIVRPLQGGKSISAGIYKLLRSESDECSFHEEARCTRADQQVPIQSTVDYLADCRSLWPPGTFTEPAQQRPARAILGPTYAPQPQLHAASTVPYQYGNGQVVRPMQFPPFPGRRVFPTRQALAGPLTNLPQSHALAQAFQLNALSMANPFLLLGGPLAMAMLQKQNTLSVIEQNKQQTDHTRIQTSGTTFGTQRDTLSESGRSVTVPNKRKTPARLGRFMGVDENMNHKDANDCSSHFSFEFDAEGSILFSRPEAPPEPFQGPIIHRELEVDLSQRQFPSSEAQRSLHDFMMGDGDEDSDDVLYAQMALRRCVWRPGNTQPQDHTGYLSRSSTHEMRRGSSEVPSVREASLDVVPVKLKDFHDMALKDNVSGDDPSDVDLNLIQASLPSFIQYDEASQRYLGRCADHSGLSVSSQSSLDSHESRNHRTDGQHGFHEIISDEDVSCYSEPVPDSYLQMYLQMHDQYQKVKKIRSSRGIDSHEPPQSAGASEDLCLLQPNVDFYQLQNVLSLLQRNAGNLTMPDDASQYGGAAQDLYTQASLHSCNQRQGPSVERQLSVHIQGLQSQRPAVRRTYHDMSDTRGMTLGHGRSVHVRSDFPAHVSGHRHGQRQNFTPLIHAATGTVNSTGGFTHKRIKPQIHAASVTSSSVSHQSYFTDEDVVDVVLEMGPGFNLDNSYVPSSVADNQSASSHQALGSSFRHPIAHSHLGAPLDPMMFMADFMMFRPPGSLPSAPESSSWPAPGQFLRPQGEGRLSQIAASSQNNPFASRDNQSCIATRTRHSTETNILTSQDRPVLCEQPVSMRKLHNGSTPSSRKWSPLTSGGQPIPRISSSRPSLYSLHRPASTQQRFPASGLNPLAPAFIPIPRISSSRPSLYSLHRPASTQQRFPASRLNPLAPAFIPSKQLTERCESTGCTALNRAGNLNLLADVAGAAGSSPSSVRLAEELSMSVTVTSAQRQAPLSSPGAESFMLPACPPMFEFNAGMLERSQNTPPARETLGAIRGMNAPSAAEYDMPATCTQRRPRGFPYQYPYQYPGIPQNTWEAPQQAYVYTNQWNTPSGLGTPTQCSGFSEDYPWSVTAGPSTPGTPPVTPSTPKGIFRTLLSSSLTASGTDTRLESDTTRTLSDIQGTIGARTSDALGKSAFPTASHVFTFQSPFDSAHTTAVNPLVHAATGTVNSTGSTMLKGDTALTSHSTPLSVVPGVALSHSKEALDSALHSSNVQLPPNLPQKTSGLTASEKIASKMKPLRSNAHFCPEELRRKLMALIDGSRGMSRLPGASFAPSVPAVCRGSGESNGMGLPSAFPSLVETARTNEGFCWSNGTANQRFPPFMETPTAYDQFARPAYPFVHAATGAWNSTSSFMGAGVVMETPKVNTDRMLPRRLTAAERAQTWTIRISHWILTQPFHDPCSHDVTEQSDFSLPQDDSQ